MTEQQLITYGLAALAALGVWLGLKIAKKIFKIIFFLVALPALAFLLTRI